MADINFSAIRAALATQIHAGTGLRASAEVKDQISPPIALVMPGMPPIVYDETLDRAVTINLVVYLLLSEAAPTEKVQRALDVYIGTGSQSIYAAIKADPTLGGTVEWCVPKNVSSYNQVEWNAIHFFGCRWNCEIGAS